MTIQIFPALHNARYKTGRADGRAAARRCTWCPDRYHTLKPATVAGFVFSVFRKKFFLENSLLFVGIGKGGIFV